MDFHASALDRALSWLRGTTLAECAGDLLRHFREGGYADATIIRYIRISAHFGEWLDHQQLAPSDYTAELADHFLHRHLPRCQCGARIDRDRKSVRAGLSHLAGVLQQRGVVSPVDNRDTIPPSIRQELGQFDEYLHHARGASEATRTYCQRYVREFLLQRFGEVSVIPEDLRAEDFRRFLLDRSHHCRSGTLGVIATALRSYLRFLVLRGHPVEHLIGAVPVAARWSKAHLPQHLTEAQEESFLHAVDRTRPSGRRDYAMFLMMCRLGLRVSEVAALTLDDIDWRTGTVAVHAPKTRRLHILPLPPEVGDAIVAYLHDGRPSNRVRRVFLRHRPPVGGALTTELIRGAVRRTYNLAGLPSSWTGTHRLRHTAAARMLQSRATLKQIADVLGHRCIDTTAIYAKVDLEVLREVALPWPGRDL